MMASITASDMVIKILSEIVKEHRRQAFITCPGTCLCWTLDEVVIRLQKHFSDTEEASDG